MKSFVSAALVLVVVGLGGCASVPEGAPATMAARTALDSRITKVTVLRAGLTGVTQRPYVYLRAEGQDLDPTVEGPLDTDPANFLRAVRRL